jgi:hypothetical protein
MHRLPWWGWVLVGLAFGLLNLALWLLLVALGV